MIQCLVGFGSNTGDLQSWFEQSIERLQQHPQIRQLRYSQPLRTKAVLGESAIAKKFNGNQSNQIAASSEYLNSVISLKTSLDVKQLFETTRKIETELGRVRSDRWTARTVDLDILLFGDQVIETDHLTIPHRRMSFRRFVLQGAVEVAPEMLHPHSRATLKALWERVCSGRRKVLWLAGGAERLDRARLAKDQLAKTSGCPFFSGPEGWEIEIYELTSVENLMHDSIEAEDYSLLLYSDCQQKFPDAACWFAGPALDLSNCSSSFLNREIVAAVEAMS